MINKISELAKNNLKISDFHLRGGSDIACRIMGEIVIEKNRPSAFYSTRLEVYLRSQRINGLVICGVTTNICVETTARDAAQRDYRTFVVKDAVGEVDLFRHEVALKALEHMFAKIVSIDDVLDAWGVKQDNAA